MAIGRDIGFGRMTEHPKRKVICDIITRDPGIGSSELSQVSGINENTLNHHLIYLESDEVIIVRRDKHKKAYFIKGVHTEHEMKQFTLLKRGNVGSTYESLFLYPGSRVDFISAYCGLDHRTVRIHLNDLISLDLAMELEGFEERRYVAKSIVKTGCDR